MCELKTESQPGGTQEAVLAHKGKQPREESSSLVVKKAQSPSSFLPFSFFFQEIACLLVVLEVP